MITGIVENWSQNPGEEFKWGISLTLKIDNISSKQTAKICDSIKQMPSVVNGLSKEIIVRFSRIENNLLVFTEEKKELSPFVLFTNIVFFTIYF